MDQPALQPIRKWSRADIPDSDNPASLDYRHKLSRFMITREWVKGVDIPDHITLN